MHRYHLIWDILVKYGGALESQRSNFIEKCGDKTCFIYKFGGDLGKEAEIWTGDCLTHYVSYNKSDVTIERNKIVENINRFLECLK